MGRFSLLILLCAIIWLFWMSWNWLRNTEKTPLVPNPDKHKENNNSTTKENNEEIS